MITAQQLQKYTQSLFNQIYPTDTYEQLKALLYAWRDNNKTPTYAISTFFKITQLLSEHSPELLEDLNRCLLKDYSPDTSLASIAKVRQLALDNPYALSILDTIIGWIRTEQPVQVNPPVLKVPQIEQLSENEFFSRLQRHQRCRQISKIIYLYRRCVVTLGEFKKLLQPIYLSDPSFFNMLFQYAEELETKRRKITIFAPLNELVDQKYPLEQVGNSYIIIPEGYANWGRRWSTNCEQKFLNRVCVSVPLGTEGSFVITRKNEFEEQLLKNQEEKYEIDSNLASLQAVIKLIQNTKKLNHPLTQKILSNIYPPDVVGLMIKSTSPQVAKFIVIPRLKQKLTELTRCRTKFQKICDEVATKNFYKSLDYRCFYFCKNDKKFNCPQRWQKQIELRKKQIIQEQITHSSGLQIQDRESLQHSRNCALNTFDNITNQLLLPEFRLQFGERRLNATYPPFPHNQILFLLDFSDSSLLNDVLEISLYHTQKKSLLQLIVFKLLRLNIQRKIQKEAAVLQFIEGKSIDDTSKEILNDMKKNKRVYKDLTDEFMQLIEEDIQPAQIQHFEFPFQGPEQNTFIGTKQIYYFVRYLLTIYHRFSRAKTLSEERGVKGDQPSLYTQFLSVLIHKIKQQKGLEEYLRKIFQQDAFIFFTLDKLIMGIVKTINNISTDSLTYKILKDGVKDYDLQIRRWEDYPHPTVSEQLTRLYRQSQTLFRFTYAPGQKCLFISAWQNKISQSDKKKKEDDNSNQQSIFAFMNDPVQCSKNIKSEILRLSEENEYVQDEDGNLIMWGEEAFMRKRLSGNSLTELEKEINKVRKLRII